MNQQEKKTICINKYKLTYSETGKGKPILFLHGGRVRANTFKRYIKILSKNYKVFAPDIPGYGDSETPKDAWSFIEYGEFFAHFLHKLHLTQVIVIGYSMGGGIAFNVAAQSSDVSELILIDSAGISLPHTKYSHQDMRRLWFYLSHPQYTSSLMIIIRDYLQFIIKHRVTINRIQHIRRACAHTSYNQILRHIRIPTTLIWGEDDWIYPLTIANEFKKHMPHAVLKTVTGNHDWLIYNPLQYKDLML